MPVEGTQSGQARVYFNQPGGGVINELVVDSTGLITVAEGGVISVSTGGNINLLGNLTVQTTGVLNVDSGGAITIDTGGHIAYPVTTQSTTSGTITNYGLTVFGTTIADAYTLAAPTRAGLHKTLMCTVHGATTVNAVVTTNSTSVTIISTSDPASVIRRTMTFTNGGQCVQLISSSTSAWVVVSNVNSVAFTS